MFGGFSVNQAPAAPGILDNYRTGMFSCIGYKRLLSSYTGPIFQIWDTVTAAFYDIYARADNQVDTVSILALTGAGSWGYKLLYDQTGQGNHFTETGLSPSVTITGQPFGGIQTTTQPASMQCINGSPASAAKTIVRSCAMSTGFAYEFGNAGNLNTASDTMCVQENLSSATFLNTYLGNNGPTVGFSRSDMTISSALGATGTFGTVFIPTLGGGTFAAIPLWHNGAKITSAGTNGGAGCAQTPFPAGNLWRIHCKSPIATAGNGILMVSNWWGFWDTDKSLDMPILSALQ